MIQEKINKWADDLSLLEGHDKLAYLIELAKSATTLPEELRTDDKLVPGCISKIWVDVGLVENKNLQKLTRGFFNFLVGMKLMTFKSLPVIINWFGPFMTAEQKVFGL